MSRDLNHVALIGRLVRDPEIRYTAGGQPVTKFSIANNVTYMQNNERKNFVNYFDVNVWGNQAVNCEKYLKKGSQVAITGNLRQNRWEDKTTKQIKSKVEITANSVQFLSPVSGDKNVGGSNQIDNNTNAGGSEIIEDPWSQNGADEFTDNSQMDSSNFDDGIPF